MAIIPVNFFRAEIEWTFEDLAEYARIMEDQITRLANAERIRLSRMSFCDESDESMNWDEYRWRFEGTIPRILRYSCIVSLLSAIEVSLDRICEKTCDYRKLSISYKKYKKRSRKTDSHSSKLLCLIFRKMSRASFLMILSYPQSKG